MYWQAEGADLVLEAGEEILFRVADVIFHKPPMVSNAQNEAAAGMFGQSCRLNQLGWLLDIAVHL